MEAGLAAGWQAKACPTIFHEVSRAERPSQDRWPAFHPLGGTQTLQPQKDPAGVDRQRLRGLSLSRFIGDAAGVSMRTRWLFSSLKKTLPERSTAIRSEERRVGKEG